MRLNLEQIKECFKALKSVSVQRDGQDRDDMDQVTVFAKVKAGVHATVIIGAKDDNLKVTLLIDSFVDYILQDFETNHLDLQDCLDIVLSTIQQKAK
jgi:hypothetical protein